VNSKYYIIIVGIIISIAVLTVIFGMETIMLVIEPEVIPIVEEPIIKEVEPIKAQQPIPTYENPLPLPVVVLEDWEKCIADETHTIHNPSNPKICYTSDGLMAREPLG